MLLLNTGHGGFVKYLTFILSVLCTLFLFQNCGNMKSLTQDSLTSESINSAAFDSKSILPIENFNHIGISFDTSKHIGNTHAYAPTTMFYQGTFYRYFCSLGDASIGSWDTVRLVTSTDGMNWSAPSIAINASNMETERAACDPSAFKFNAGDGDYFYILYSGNAKNIETVNFIARSASPRGPFLKYTMRGTWEENAPDPKIIHFPQQHGTSYYGAGQPTAVVKDGELQVWYTDTTTEFPGPQVNKIFFRKSKDAIHWSKPILTNIGNSEASSEVKFSPLLNKYIFFSLLDGHGTNASITIRTSDDGITWSERTTLCDSQCTPDWTHNIGVSGDEFGHMIGFTTIISYGAPFDNNPNYDNDCDKSPTPLCWGHWDLFDSVLNLIEEGPYSSLAQVLKNKHPQTSIAKAPLGNLDSIEGGQIKGWALDQDNLGKSTEVHIYFNDTDGYPIKTSILRSDVNSTLQVSGNNGFSFKIPIQYFNNDQHNIKVYAIDSGGLYSSQLIGETTFTASSNLCLISGGAGASLESKSSSKEVCQTLCAQYENSHPQRQCQWGTQIIRQQPKGLCHIVGGAKRVLFSQTETRNSCLLECNNLTQNTNRECRWKNDIFRPDPR